MVHSVRVSCLCLLMVLPCAVGACGGGDDDDDSGGGGAGVSGSAAGSTAAGSKAAGSGGGGSTEFDAGSDDGRNDVVAGKLCERAATILCAGEAACCDNPGNDFAGCKATVLKTCSNNYMLDQIAMDARVGFNAGNASKSFEMLEKRASMCDPTVTAWIVSSTGFATSLDGTKAMGEDCTPMGGAQNASVAELLTSLASCSSGLACLPSATTWTCAPRSSKGGNCGTDANCAEGLHCNDPKGELDGTGTCVDRLAGGAECLDDLECASLICTSGKCAVDDDVQAAYCLD